MIQLLADTVVGLAAALAFMAATYYIGLGIDALTHTTRDFPDYKWCIRVVLGLLAIGTIVFLAELGKALRLG